MLATLLLAGCFSLGPTETTTRYYVLGSLTDEVPVEQPARSDATIGLTRFSLPPYLESMRIVARRGTNRISFAEFDRWGEDLDRGISRTVAAHLARMLPVRKVEAAPWSVGSRPDAAIHVRVMRFEGVAASEEATGGSAGSVHLLAAWEIVDTTSREVLANGTTDYREQGWRTGDYAHLVSMLDEALLVLSREIARAVPAL